MKLQLQRTDPKWHENYVCLCMWVTLIELPSTNIPRMTAKENHIENLRRRCGMCVGATSWGRWNNMHLVKWCKSWYTTCSHDKTIHGSCTIYCHYGAYTPPSLSTIQTYFRVSVLTSDSFFVWQKKKSSTNPASPSSRGVARNNIDVASRTIHTLAAFHWHTHRQGRLLFGQQAFQGCDEDLLCHDLPDFLKAVIRKKRVDFNFVNVWVSNEPWEIILV